MTGSHNDIRDRVCKDRATDEQRQGRGEGDRMCSCLMYRTTNDANYTNDKDRMDEMDRIVGWAQ